MESPLTDTVSLKRTPLNAVHLEAGGKMVGFAGWEMPVQYDGVIEEHLAVRSRVGLFDVSHMGEIEVRGPKALDSLQRLTCNDVSRLAAGRAQYSALTTEKGTIIDDVIVYRRAEDLFLVVVNAANEEKDFAWVAANMIPGAEAANTSSEYAQIAIQGPDAFTILTGLAEADLEPIRPFAFVEAPVAGIRCIIARTGYTGEDGFELYCSPGPAPELWQTLIAAGAPFGITPCGLGARDTLRLEACLMLYGQDIDETTSVLEAGLGFILKLDKGPFIGREALQRQKEKGLARRLCAFEMIERGIPRHGYAVRHGGGEAGHVTSGTHGPSVKKAIGMAYVPVAAGKEGAEFDVVIRGREARARVVKPPFYRRSAAGH